MDKIQISMTSNKGVMLKTLSKFCDKDIVVTPEVEELTVTENGEYISSKVGYSKVNVNIEASEDLDAELAEQEELIAELKDTLMNGTGEGIPADLYFEGGYAEVELPNATKIKQYAFFSDTGLINISMPRVTSIGTGAFSGCSNLALTSLPDGVTSISNQAFRNCSNLALTSLPNGVTSIGEYTFSGCTNLAFPSLPDGVTNIDKQAFSQCPNLAFTSLPDSVTRIGDGAFQLCSKLAITSLPASLTTLGNSAFFSCGVIKEITFKGTPSSIGFTALNGMNLKTINVPWAEGAVANAPWGATEATINYNYTGG